MLNSSKAGVAKILPKSGSFLLSYLRDDELPSLFMDDDKEMYKKARETREYTWFDHVQYGKCLYTHDLEEDKWVRVSPRSLVEYLVDETSQLIIFPTSGRKFESYN